MSLSQFHLFFIAASIFICAAFGYWGIQNYLNEMVGGSMLALAVGSIMLGIGLVVYEVKVYRKFKTLEV
ncbi:MAG: hypothetical protein IID15_02520 [Candidatus Marinimicrobia bacterium]|nr:hypothetical protein [Candidatus Neomarinimicrobiota bacterium]